jgi:aromatic-L-amino-acid decarboxylase
MTDNAPVAGDMDMETFRRSGYQIIDWIAEYLSHPENYPVFAQTQPGDIRVQLPDHPPASPEAMEAIVQDFERIILPGITHWNHPAFFAYFGITGSAPGILGELLASALNVNAMLWRTSPAATELEETTLDWLRQMLGLSADFRGCIMDTASVSTLVAIAAARERLNLHIRQQGMAGRADVPRLRMYTSEQAHSSVEKGAIVLGIGQEGVRKIATDDQFRMDVEQLRLAIAADKAAGWLPFCVVASVGTTSTTSIDPVPAIADLCQQHKMWLHVDGAYGGTAALVPEMRHVLDGCERADSLVVNPHKWMFTPIDCSAFYVRDVALLKQAFSLVPEYLKSDETDVNNYMDWGVQLGRRFRALKLWMVIRHFGYEGLVGNIREHIRLGQMLAQRVDARADFVRMAPTPFSTVCFRAVPRAVVEQLAHASAEEAQALEARLDQLNEQIITTINASGEAFISHTRLRGHYTIRVAIGNIRTSEEHINRLWDSICKAMDAGMR